MTCGIYLITNTVDGKQYVGVSQYIEGRWDSHRSDLQRGKHHARRLQQAWSEHGEAAFQFSILEACGTDEFSRKEPFYIEKFRSNDPEYGYNTQYGKEMKYNPYCVSARVGSPGDIDFAGDSEWLSKLEEGLDLVLVGFALRLNLTADDVRRFRELMAEIQL